MQQCWYNPHTKETSWFHPVTGQPWMSAPEVPIAGAAPSEEGGEGHLQSLVLAAIEALELDAESTLSWIRSLTPEDVKTTLKKSPFAFVSTLLASHHTASSAATSSASAAAHAAAAFASSFASPRMHASPSYNQHAGQNWKQQFKQHFKQHHKKTASSVEGCGRQVAAGDVPPIPSAGLLMGAEGDNVVALQKNLALLGFMRCGRNFHKRSGKFDHKTSDAVFRFQHSVASKDLLHSFVPGIFCEATRAALVFKVDAALCAARQFAGNSEACEPTLLPQACATQAGTSAHEEKVQHQEYEVTITDTDGDEMMFKLSPDGSRVQEWVNGALEIDQVKWIQMDAQTGSVRDSKGRFTLQTDQIEIKMQALTALLVIALIPTHTQTLAMILPVSCLSGCAAAHRLSARSPRATRVTFASLGFTRTDLIYLF